MSVQKPCRLEINNSGSWKLLGKFDAGAEASTDAILDAAARLGAALNDKACGRPGLCTLRVSTDDAQPDVLMRWANEDAGWQKAT
jgi:hypothetical protein